MNDADEDRLSVVEAALGRGEVVALPTDTVYGVGVLAGHRLAADRVFALKGRPETVALPVLVADLETAVQLASADVIGLDLLGARLWPGALTVVVPRREGLEWALGGDGRTIGIRCPDHDLLRRLLGRTGPLAVSSANRHGGSPATTPEDVRRIFGAGLLCLDAGRCDRPSSTVVSLVGGKPSVIREGAVSLADVLRALDPAGGPVRRRPGGAGMAN